MKNEILKVLKDKYDALDLISINDLLKYKTAEELKELELALNELEQEFKIFKTKKNKYILYDNCPNMKVGKLSINKKGDGFLLLDGDDLYVNSRNLNGGINGDIVLAETFQFHNAVEGKIIRILERNTKNIVGTVVYRENDLYLELDDTKNSIEIIIDKESASSCVEGTKVLVNAVKELSQNKYLGRVVKVIGHKNDPGVDIKSVAYKYGIFEEFSKETEKQLETIPTEVDVKDLIGRRDLTTKEIFTIDGAHTKDIDDAICVEYIDGIYKLGVHIADVSNYVTKDSPLDTDAYARGTSSYLADSVIPMIPHKLSNGICSLNPEVIRLTISCEMEIDEKGNVKKYDIFPSYIKSKKKMTYEAVNDILMRNIIAEGYEPYVPALRKMNELAHILRNHKIRRGYIDFGIDEAELIVDKDGKCIDVKKRVREDGEKLIEDFMIAANETVATHVYNMDLPFLYRIHGIPKAERIDSFLHLVSLLGYTIIGKFKDLNPSSMQQILSQLEDKPEYTILSSILLRSMQKAVYSNDNIGHFGLGSKCYTHFTSPIRRYPDLTVHRLLREYLFDANVDNQTINKWNAQLPDTCTHTSEREQEAVEAEREVDDMKMAEYMENHIGEVYTGYISTVTSFGFFVQLDNLVEGLVHVNALTNDYYNYIPEMMALIGAQSKKQYRLGDKLTVKVIGASKEARTIDFEVVEGEKNGNKK